MRQPFLQLITDLQPALAEVSAHFRADPRGNGGSLFRIYRDARFSNDKSPYKTWQGARFFHERRRQVPAPSFYVHLQPGESFVGAGLWHPEPDTQRKVRQFIFENPGSWKAAAYEAKLRRRFDLEETEKLVRAPHGFPAEFEFIEDLKHRNWVMWRSLDDDMMTGPRLRQTVATDLAAGSVRGLSVRSIGPGVLTSASHAVPDRKAGVRHEEALADRPAAGRLRAGRLSSSPAPTWRSEASARRSNDRTPPRLNAMSTSHGYAPTSRRSSTTMSCAA